MSNYKIEYVDPNTLQYRPDNRNFHPPEQIERLAKLIEYNGFRVPVIVSKLSGLVVAGHGRFDAAKQVGLKEVPVIYQDFQNEDEEWQFHIADNAIPAWANLDLSQINKDIQNFGPFDIDLLAIRDFVVELSEKDNENPYTRKIESPIYEITGEKPSISQLFDSSKTNELLKEIEQSKINEDVKQFLRLCSYRHLKFNYKMIAEFYAHCNQEEQNLFEKNAVVIIDFDKAIELGFVKLTKNVQDQYAKEN